jgi:hypothetical protein
MRVFNVAMIIGCWHQYNESVQCGNDNRHYTDVNSLLSLPHWTLTLNWCQQPIIIATLNTHINDVNSLLMPHWTLTLNWCQQPIIIAKAVDISIMWVFNVAMIIGCWHQYNASVQCGNDNRLTSLMWVFNVAMIIGYIILMSTAYYHCHIEHSH